jgi:hypothetical protein
MSLREEGVEMRAGFDVGPLFRSAVGSGRPPGSGVRLGDRSTEAAAL